MLFRASFPWLEIQDVIAWLVLLFQLVIFFAENSDHHKQNKKGRPDGRFFMAGFVKKYDSGAARPLFRARHGILLSRAATPSPASIHGQDLLHPEIHRQRWRLDCFREVRQA